MGHEKVLTRLEFDHQAEVMLSKVGYTRETIPEKDEIVFLRSTANLSTGGTAIDVTDSPNVDIKKSFLTHSSRTGGFPHAELP